jgi:putative hemolysin
MEKIKSRRNAPHLRALLANQIEARLAKHPGLLHLYDEMRSEAGESVLDRLQAAIGVAVSVRDADRAKIPSGGATMVVANHPFGLLDGAVLLNLLLHVRPDVKILVNHMLASIPELRPWSIYVDTLHGDSERNMAGLKQGLAWLRQGGMLAVFPAGEVSHWDVRQGQSNDPKWTLSAGWLLHRAAAMAVPVYFPGSNSAAFHALGLVHARLRTLRLPEELLRQKGRKIEVRVGTPIETDALAGLRTEQEVTDYLRWRTYLLAKRGEQEQNPLVQLRTVLQGPARKVVPEIDSGLLAHEVNELPESCRLATHQNLRVYEARAEEIPAVLREIGRLREITFRDTGEGTNQSTDIDRFDAYYDHLFVWDDEARRVVGSYRMGHIPTILREHGIRGLYTSTLFHYSPAVFQRIGPAWELGRSFVRAEYQKQYAPLLLLWKGIAAKVAQRPDTPCLLGAVSVSNRYSRRSRELLVRFLERGRGGDLQPGLLRPRRGFTVAAGRAEEAQFVTTCFRDFDDFARLIEDLEEDGKSVPILLRHYCKLGGRFLGFNLDPSFNDALDGLVLLDLRQTDPTALNRYMGREAYQAFRRHHEAASPVEGVRREATAPSLTGN